MTRNWRAATAAVSTLLVVALAAAVGPVSARSALAAVSRHNGRLIYQDGASGQLYTVNPDGSALRQVTSKGYNATPEWSPDGRRIAYASNRSGSFQIWIARADGSAAMRLTDNPDGKFFPRFTPDGRTIIYQDCLGSGCDGGIFAVRTDGTHRHVIKPNSGESYNWAVPSPNGRRLAYMRWHVGGVKMRIFVSPFGGGAERPVTPARLEAWGPDWSPDGQRILFTSNIFFDRPNASLYTVRPDGTGLRRLTTPPWPRDDFTASYSPDGTTIVFDSNRRYPDLCCNDLYLMTANGHALRRIPLPSDQPVYARWGTAPLLTGPSQRIVAAPITAGEIAGRRQFCSLMGSPDRAC